MFLKFSLSKKIIIKIAISLILLLILAAIYFASLSYFHQQILMKQKIAIINLSDYNKAAASTDKDTKATEDTATSSNFIQKIDNELSSLYSFFFELPQSDKTSDSSNGEKSSTLILGSFPYTLSIVDKDKTNLRFDGVTSAVTFSLNYEWTTASEEVVATNKNKFNAYSFNQFKGPYNDKNCLQNNCLEQKGNKLYYNGRPVSLPISIKNLQAISIGIIANRFVVGFTSKNTEYQAEAFYFDNLKFSKIPNLKTIYSSNFGLLGFGGEANDFLVIYGAYKGQIFRVRDGQVINLDKFTSHRLMNNGFKAEIIKVKNNNYVNWYITSATVSNPQFIKLWQDDKGEIVGAVSLLNELKISDQLELKLLDVTSNKASFLAHLKSDTQDYWQVFNDYGFKNKQTANLVTLPLSHNSSNAEVFVKKIGLSELSLDTQGQPFVKTEVSFDGSTWKKITWGNNIDFEQKGSKSYFIKIIFSPVINSFYSPFIDNIMFTYLYSI
ncbi:MAG: hypothetical protein WAW11_03050 [Patescibacteria group bacterium]